MLEHASFTWLFSDTAFLHSILCASYAVSDLLRPNSGGRPSRKTLTHLRTTLRLLREKMDANPYAHEDEAVLAVAVNLTVLSLMFGDFSAALTHGQGVNRIVQLRGHFAFLNSRPKLHCKLDAMDLTYSISSGKPAHFLQPSVSWHAAVPPPYTPLPADLYPPAATWDPRLQNIYTDFQHLALRINALERARHDPSTYQHILTSLQSRLLHLRDALASPVENLVHVALLAMLTATSKPPGKKSPYKWANERLQARWGDAFGGVSGDDITLKVWVLLVAAISVCGTGPAWIRKAWAETRGGRGWGWEGVRARCRRVMWISVIHDRLGAVAFEALEKAAWS